MSSHATESHLQPKAREVTAAPAVPSVPQLPLPQLSVPRLYLLRSGYLVLAVGLALAKWPLIFSHDGPWPPFEGVETCMLVALSLLWFLGLRYPLKMLPLLLFEIGWKLIWFAVVALPLLTGDGLDPVSQSFVFACLWVVIPLAVVPWDYVVRQFVTSKGDPWRAGAAQRG